MTPRAMLARTLRLSRLLLPTCRARPWKVATAWASNVSGDDDEEEESLRRRVEGIRGQYFLPATGHKVILVQPRRHENRPVTVEEAGELMEEARALVDSMETWTIVDEVTTTLRHPSQSVLFTSGVLDELTRRVRAHEDATAVVVNWPMLSGLQMASLQALWRRQVYDRFTLVLQIFRLHARSREARLQVALAELPYMRSRLTGIHSGSLHGADEGLLSPAVVEDASLSTKMMHLSAYEHKLRQKMKKMEEKREFLRARRRESEVPSVTVVGYTNAGKTSLVRVLTSDARAKPLDRLFATLDTSGHAGLLPNRLRVVFVDTVGFMADVPAALLGAFRATLRDCMDTDLLVHVIDASNKHGHAQRQHVHAVLRELRLPKHLTASMVEVANKSDRQPERALAFQDDFPGVHLVSCHTGRGLDGLQRAILAALQRNLGLVRRRIRARIGGAVFDWLHKEATVEGLEVCPDDENKAVITVLFSPKVLSQFQARFQKAQSGS